MRRGLRARTPGSGNSSASHSFYRDPLNYANKGNYTPGSMHTPNSRRDSGISGAGDTSIFSYSDTHARYHGGGGNTPSAPRYDRENYYDNSMHELDIVDGSTDEGNAGMRAMKRKCEAWVIVSGIFPDNKRIKKINSIFNDRYTVESVKESTSNWVLVRFCNPEEAKRAKEQHDNTMVQNGTLIISVQQMTIEVAQSMNLQLQESKQLYTLYLLLLHLLLFVPMLT